MEILPIIILIILSASVARSEQCDSTRLQELESIPLYKMDEYQNKEYQRLINICGVSHYRKNSLYFELAGSGLSYSLNYDRAQFDFGEANTIGIRIGLEYNILLKAFQFGGFPLTVPIISYYLIGKTHNLEIGFGVTPNFIIPYSIMIFITPVIGYRFQSPSGGFLFRAGFTPLFIPSLYSKENVLMWFWPFIGISWGYAF